MDITSEIIMHDIQSETDIKELIDKFYIKVIADPFIGHIFTDIVSLSWEKHIPVMNSFWCSILLGTNSYSGNPMAKHIELDHKVKLTRNHFDRWLELWESTIDENFGGSVANEAKSRAVAIAAIMQSKIARHALL
jgi:hemoglobin